MAKSVEPSSVSTAPSSGATGLQRLGYAIASIPFVLFVIGQVIAHGFLQPIFENPPALLGLPAGIAAPAGRSSTPSSRDR